MRGFPTGGALRLAVDQFGVNKSADRWLLKEEGADRAGRERGQSEPGKTKWRLNKKSRWKKGIEGVRKDPDA